MLRKKLFALAFAATVILGGGVNAQEYPFPQDVVYPNGYMPTQSFTAKTQSWYESWKNAHVRECSGKGLMPTADGPNQVKVEGMGWAMIAAAYMGDKTSFDGFYTFYKSKLVSSSGNMMAWDVTCEGISDQGSATDGDLDVAFGLVVASWQWPTATDNYLSEAKKVIGYTEALIRECEGVYALAGGYSVGGPYGGTCDSYTDISYYFPAYFRVFAEVVDNPTSKAKWAKLADDTYIHLKRNRNATTGIVSNWQNVKTGAAMTGPSGNAYQDTAFRHDASRVAWRIGLDYLWYGTEDAKEWLILFTNWAGGKFNADGTSHTLVEGYARNGTALSTQDAGLAFTGSWAVGAMANPDETVRNNFWNHVAGRNDSYWYSKHLGNMYFLTLSGNMWNLDMVGGEGYRLTAATTPASGGGTITRVPNKTRYSAGETVTLTADPTDDNWEFVGWEGDVTGTEKTITITMNEDKSVTAVFNLKVTGNNLIKDPTFSQPIGISGSTSTDWTLNRWGNTELGEQEGDNPSLASYSQGTDNSITITVNTVRANPWDIQLVQEGLPLLAGKTYEVSFDISASTEREIVAMCQLKVSPWTGYFDTTLEVSQTMRTVTFEFTMEADDPDARIGFNLAQATGSVTIGNVSIVLKGNTPVREKINPQSIKQTRSLRVTAKKSAVNVKFKAKSTGVTELRLYGLRGEVVARAKINTVAGKAYAHTFNTAKLPNGVYVVSAQNGASIERSKVIVK